LAPVTTTAKEFCFQFRGGTSPLGLIRRNGLLAGQLRSFGPKSQETEMSSTMSTTVTTYKEEGGNAAS
jgi:hypothetical protein